MFRWIIAQRTAPPSITVDTPDSNREVRIQDRHGKTINIDVADLPALSNTLLQAHGSFWGISAPPLPDNVQRLDL